MPSRSLRNCWSAVSLAPLFTHSPPLPSTTILRGLPACSHSCSPLCFERNFYLLPLLRQAGRQRQMVCGFYAEGARISLQLRLSRTIVYSSSLCRCCAECVSVLLWSSRRKKNHRFNSQPFHKSPIMVIKAIRLEWRIGSGSLGMQWRSE